MFKSKNILRVLVSTLALSAMVGCAGQPYQPRADMESVPELAGAWYQVYFDSEGSTIDERGRMIVKTVADVAENNGPTRVSVIGKTDRVGTKSENMVLSRQRADVVRDALIAAGVPAGHIDTSWTGENRQEVATANNVSEQGNRVVDITVLKLSR